VSAKGKRIMPSTERGSSDSSDGNHPNNNSGNGRRNTSGPIQTNQYRPTRLTTEITRVAHPHIDDSYNAKGLGPKAETGPRRAEASVPTFKPTVTTHKPTKGE